MGMLTEGHDDHGVPPNLGLESISEPYSNRDLNPQCVRLASAVGPRQFTLANQFFSERFFSCFFCFFGRLENRNRKLESRNQLIHFKPDPADF
jgi:hypothetical protein